jgi:TolB-like protein
MHMGEVSERLVDDGEATGVEGLAVDLAARICGLARPGQLLMSSPVADSARARLDTSAFDETIRWRAHGAYLLKGFDEVLQIREAGLDGVARFEPPTASDKAVPVRSPGSRAGRNWLPGVAVAILALAAGVVTWFMWPHATVQPAPGPMADTAAEKPDRPLTVPGFGDRPAIAVLPFDNLSVDPEQAYFADGLTEDLITRLSLFRSFPVIARNSTFVFKGKAVDIKALSADLGARYVVEGSVRSDGDRVRIVAQLIDATSGEHVWAGTYERELTDIFAVQDEISASIAASMVGDLQRAEQAYAAHRDPENLQAWELYQRALPLIYRSTREGNIEAYALLERAVSLDPGFVPARAKLSETLLWRFMGGWTDTAEADLERAFGEARTAVDIDPRDAGARASLALALALKGEIGRAVEEAQQATALNPSEIMAMANVAYYATAAGQSPEASIGLVDRAMRLSPHDPMEFLFYDALGMAYFCAGRYTEGLGAARRLIALRPTYVQGYFYAAMNAAELGQLDEAREFVQQASMLRSDLSLALARTILGGMAPDVDGRVSAALLKAGLV